METKIGVPSIREFNEFVRTDLKRRLVKRAKEHAILCEADLQSFCFHEVRKWIKARDSAKIFRVHNTFLLRDLRMRPDIVILRKDRPWILMELKEQRLLNAEAAQAEGERLSQISKSLSKHLKKMKGHAYVLRLAGKGNVQGLKECASPRVPNAHFFPIILKHEFKMTQEKFDTWWQERRLLAKYDPAQHGKKGA